MTDRRARSQVAVLAAATMLVMPLSWMSEARGQEPATEAKIARLGKVGSRHVYRVNGTVFGLSEGDSIGNCIVRPSGLDCGSGTQDLASEIERQTAGCAKERDNRIAEIHDLRSDLGRAKAEAEAARAEAANLKSKSGDMTGANRKHEEQIRRLKADASEMEGEIDRLEGEMRKQKKDLAGESRKAKVAESASIRKDREIAELREGNCYNPPRPVGAKGGKDKSPYQKAWSDLVYVPCDSCRREDIRPPSVPNKEMDAPARPPVRPFFDPAEGQDKPDGTGHGDARTQKSSLEDVSPPPAFHQSDLKDDGNGQGAGRTAGATKARQTPPPASPSTAVPPSRTQGERKAVVVHFRPDSGQVVVSGENSLFDAMAGIKSSNGGKVRVVGVACAETNGEALAKARADVIAKNLEKNGIAGATVATNVERCSTPKDSLFAARAELYVTGRP